MGSGSSKNRKRNRKIHSKFYDDDDDEDYSSYDDDSEYTASPGPDTPEIRRSNGGRRTMSMPYSGTNDLGATMKSLNIVTKKNENNSKLQAQRQKWKSETGVHVVARVRPLNMREIKSGDNDVVYIDEIKNEVTIVAPKPSKMIASTGGNPNRSITFSFDRCYLANTTTESIYNEIPYSLVQGVLEGYNATVLAYGQTGSGKSFTMQEDPEHIGIIPRAIVHIFEGKEQEEDRNTRYTVQVSYVEIYNEEIRDLLSTRPNRKLEVTGNQGNILGLTIRDVETVGHCAELLKQGIANRITSATTMNLHSSRSHAIFTIWVEVFSVDNHGNKILRKAKLNLVDLAGSERHGKTGISTDQGKAFTESKSINLSLSTLGKVIQALSQDKPGHIPYRESKLTRILQDSLGGNAKTMMIACLSPADSNFEESLSTLKYAHNTKYINNKPVVNVEKDPKDEVIKNLQNEIKRLRNQLNE